MYIEYMLAVFKVEGKNNLFKGLDEWKHGSDYEYVILMILGLFTLIMDMSFSTLAQLVFRVG